jgi:hypothetical protein
MDEFTERHLARWIDASVYEDDRAQFHAYATRCINDDPTYDWNYPSLYRSFLLQQKTNKKETT